MAIAYLRSAVGLLAILIAVTAAAQGQETIPQIAARSTDPFYTTRTRELMPVPFGDMVREADLIVRGIVHPKATYLSPDQREIYTDYLLQPLETYAGRPRVGPKPGTPDVVVKHYGGRMTFGNIFVEAIDTNLPPFQSGSELVLFLKFSDKENCYTIVGTVTGAFGVTNGSVAPLLSPPLDYKEFKGLKLGDFARAIARERGR